MTEFENLRAFLNFQHIAGYYYRVSYRENLKIIYLLIKFDITTIG